MPQLPVQLHGTEDQAFDVASITLPLFSRPLANLWSCAATVHYEGVTLRLFDFVHADMLGEGSGMSSRSGLTIVSCALALVDADMPLVVVRPRREPFTLPDRLRQYETGRVQRQVSALQRRCLCGHGHRGSANNSGGPGV